MNEEKIDLIRAMSGMNEIIMKMTALIDILFVRLAQHVETDELEEVAKSIPEIVGLREKWGV